MLAFVFTLLLSTSFAQHTDGLWANSSTPALSKLSSSSVSTSSLLTVVQQSSSSDVKTTSNNIGDFVAAGLGMTRSADTSLTTSSSATTESDDTTLTSTTSSATAIATQPSSGNYTLSFTGNCWEQWTSYWSASSSASSAVTRVSVPATNTFTLTIWSISASTERFSGTTTVTVKNGAFAQTTFTTFAETSNAYVVVTSSPTRTVVRTATYDNGTISSLFHGTIVQPTCVLPTLMPECQSNWENWVSGKFESYPPEPTACASYQYSAVSLQPPSCQGPLSSYSYAASIVGQNNNRSPPPCTQATVTGAICSTLVKSYLQVAKAYNQQIDGVIAGGMNYTTYTTTEAANSHVATVTSNVFFWDPSSSLAPGCTLGCNSCQINGGTVQLIYWPPASSTWIDGNYSAITGNSNKTVTVVTLGTTLTSPTVYVSFDSLYARDSCSAFSKTYTNEIVAITETANLSSLYGWARYNGLGATASFNFTDLWVPRCRYQSQDESTDIAQICESST
jgi:hypothetical protein